MSVIWFTCMPTQVSFCLCIKYFRHLALCHILFYWRSWLWFLRLQTVLEDLNMTPKFFVVLVTQVAFFWVLSKVIIWNENTFINLFDIAGIYFLLKMPDVCYNESYKSSVIIFDVICKSLRFETYLLKPCSFCESICIVSAERTIVHNVRTGHEILLCSSCYSADELILVEIGRDLYRVQAEQKEFKKCLAI